MTRLSPKARQVLRDIAAGRGPWHGAKKNKDVAARSRMLCSLRRNGLLGLGTFSLTPLGRDLVEIWEARER
jgi:hypothetical protein